MTLAITSRKHDRMKAQISRRLKSIDDLPVEMIEERASKKRRCSFSDAPAFGTTTMTFMHLPREVREQIYDYALRVDNNIALFHMDWKKAKGDTRFEVTEAVVDKDATAKSIKNIAVHLIRASRTLHAEGAPILYGKNVFSFWGQHDWRMEIDWLTSIGPINRGYLNILETTMREPSWGFQYEDGSRLGYKDEYIPAGPRPRNPVLQLRPSGYGRTETGGWEEGAVHDVDPHWEDLFRLISDGQAGATRFQLRVFNGSSGFPGAMEVEEDQSGNELWYSMDIPNVLEVWREKHAAPTNSKGREIDMVWRSYRRTVDSLEGFFNRVHDCGWDLVEDTEWPYPPEGPGDRHNQDGPELLTMRRRPITGAVYADGPNPYGGFAWDPLGRDPWTGPAVTS